MQSEISTGLRAPRRRVRIKRAPTKKPVPTPAPSPEDVHPYSHTPGLVRPGNINLAHRPPVRNKNGTASTVRSISIGVGHHEVLIPTVVHGKVVSNRQAIAHFKRTGEHLGIFDSIDAANHYAKQLHEAQASALQDAQRAAARAFARQPHAEPGHMTPLSPAQARKREDQAYGDVFEAGLGIKPNKSLLDKAMSLPGIKQARGAARFGALTAGQLGDQAIYAGPGAVELVRGVGEDLASAGGALGHAVGSKHAHGDLRFKHTTKLVKAMYHQVGKDIHDPTGRPGYLLVDLLPAAGVVGKVAHVGEAVRAAEGAGRVGAGAKALVTRRPPESFPITVKREGMPPQTVYRPLSENIVRRGGQKLLYKEQQRRLNQPDRPIRGGVPTKDVLQHRYGFPAKVAGAIDKLATPQVKLGQMLHELLGPERMFGRELRSVRRIRRDLAQAPLHEYRAAVGGTMSKAPSLDRLPKKLRRGITRAERKALQAQSIFGDEAVANPAVVGRAVSYHDEKAQIARDEVEQLQASVDSHEAALNDAVNHGAWDEVAQLQPALKEAEAALADARDLLQRHEIQVADFKMARGALERLNAGTASTRFQKASRLTRELAGRREAMYAPHGLLSEESKTWRVAAPAAEYAGEPTHVTERRFVASPQNESPRVGELRATLERLNRELDSVDRRFQQSAKRRRPRTRAEAQARLDDLYAEYEPFFEQMMARVDPYGPEAARIEQLRRNKASGLIRHFERTGVRKRGLAKALRTGKLPTVRSEIVKLAENAIEAMLAKYPDRPGIQSFAAARDEMNRLEEALAMPAHLNEVEREIFGDPGEVSHLLGTEPVGGDLRLGTYGSKLKDFREKIVRELQAAEAEHPYVAPAVEEFQRRAELTPPPGAYRTPLSAPETGGASAVFSTPRLGKFGKAKPQPGRIDPATTHEFTLKEIRAGYLTADVPSAQAGSYLKATRVVSSLDFHDQLWQLSTSSRRTAAQVPIRDWHRVDPKVKALIRRSDERLPITERELNGLDAHDLETLWEELRPAQVEREGVKIDLARAPIGTDLTDAGVRWVDPKFIADLGDVEPPDNLIRLLDHINNPARTLILYARGGYILNLPGNWGMQAFTQGHLAPAMYARAFRIERDYGERNAAKIYSLVGEGKARGLTVDSGILAGTNQRLAGFWSAFVDRQSRVSSFLYWAKRHGIDLDDPKAMDRLLSDPSLEPVLQGIARRANKDMVEFNNLTPLERNTIRHLIFVYPWVSRATLWALRALAEHPVKSFTLGQLGRIAEKRLADDISRILKLPPQALDRLLPSYLRNRGYVEAPGGLASTSGLSTFQTAPEIGEELAAMVRGGGSLQPREAASPGLDILLGAATGESSRGQKYHSGGLLGSITETLSSLPQLQLLARVGVEHLGPLQIGHNPNPRLGPTQQPVFGARNLKEAVGGFLLGSAFSRATDYEAARAKALKEHLESLPPLERTAERTRLVEDDLLKQARELKVATPQTIEAMKPVFARYRERQLAYAHAADALGVPMQRLTQRDRLRVDLEVLEKMGKVDHATAVATWKAWEGLGREQIKDRRRRMLSPRFDLSAIGTLRGRIRERGGKA